MNIGDHIPQSWQGEISRARRRHRLLTRPGVDGSGALFGAWHTPTAEITTHLLISAGTGDFSCQQLEETITTSVTVTDPKGIEYTCLVLDVQAIWRKTIDPNYDLLTATWLLLPATEVPDNAP